MPKYIAALMLAIGLSFSWTAQAQPDNCVNIEQSQNAEIIEMKKTLAKEFKKGLKTSGHSLLKDIYVSYQFQTLESAPEIISISSLANQVAMSPEEEKAVEAVIKLKAKPFPPDTCYYGNFYLAPPPRKEFDWRIFTAPLFWPLIKE